MVFPFDMFPGADSPLGPEMKTTGEIMGIADTFGLSFHKAQEAAGLRLPKKGNVLLTAADKDKPGLLPVAKRTDKMGFHIYATEGTSCFLKGHAISSTKIDKIHEGGRPNIVDAIKNKDVHLIINTPGGREGKYDDSYIRMMAIQHRVPYITPMAAVQARRGYRSCKRTGNCVLRCFSFIGPNP